MYVLDFIITLLALGLFCAVNINLHHLTIHSWFLLRLYLLRHRIRDFFHIKSKISLEYLG